MEGAPQLALRRADTRSQHESEKGGYRRHLQSVTAANLRTLERYREEAATLRWIEREGMNRGWLVTGTPPSRALRNNLLYDVFVDLRGRQVESARTRLAFARDEAPDLAWDLAARVVSQCAANVHSHTP